MSSSAVRSWQQFAGIQDPCRIEPLLDGAQDVDPQLTDLGGEPGRVIGADRVVVGDGARPRATIASVAARFAASHCPSGSRRDAGASTVKYSEAPAGYRWDT